jgi:hypothetical protein
MKRGLKGKYVADVEDVKKKKRIASDELKKMF